MQIVASCLQHDFADFAQCLVKSSPNMYADDTSVTCSAEDIDTLCDDLRTELTNISMLMRQN